MSRVALYVRVSTEEQQKHGISVDSQIVALQEYAEAHGHIVVGLYNDAGISARKSYTKRPDLLRLMTDCEAHKIDLILFTKLDRWFRSVGDYYEVQKVLEKYHVCWRAIWEDYETETANGIFKVNIMLSVAQSEADRTSERIKNIFNYKRSKGEACSGGVATGYVLKDKRWYVDKEKQPAVEAFFNTYLATYQTNKARDAYRAYGFDLALETARKMITSPCYYGGESYVAEAYITQEQYDEIQKHRKRNIHRRKHEYIFSSLLYCGLCGAKLHGCRQIRINKDGSECHTVRYECSNWNNHRGCTGTTITERFLEGYMLDTFDSALSAYNIKITTVTKSDNSQKLAGAKSKLERIKNLYELGDMDFTEYKKKRLLLLEDIKKYESCKEPVPITLPDNWKDIYRQLDVSHKRAFWEKTIDHIEIPTRSARTGVIIF